MSNIRYAFKSKKSGRFFKWIGFNYNSDALYIDIGNEPNILGYNFLSSEFKMPITCRKIHFKNHKYNEIKIIEL